MDQPANQQLTNQTPKNHPGRPTEYNPKMIEILDSQPEYPGGATITEICELLGCNYRYIYRWMDAHVDFCQAISRARGRADKKVEKSVFSAACGYEHPEDKIFPGRKSGDPPIIVPTTKRYPTAIDAAMFWLTNRDPKHWQRKEQIEVDIAPLVVIAKRVVSEIVGQEVDKLSGELSTEKRQLSTDSDPCGQKK